MESLPPPENEPGARCARDLVVAPEAIDGPAAFEFIPPSADEVAAEAKAAAGVLRRVRRISVAAWVAFSCFTLISSGFAALVGLTCSALVVMINFLWLEGIVSSVLRPEPHLHAWRLTVRTLGRFALLGVAISVTIFVARFNALSVLLGFSVVVVGIIGEALYSTYRSFAG